MVRRSTGPTLHVGTRLSLHVEEAASEPERPTDLMSINYEIDEGVTAEEVLAAWPKGAAAETDRKLIGLLTNTLIAALEDAIEAEVEGKRGYGTSDVDVPSVAEHRQNTHRAGFLPIVRVAAELWTRLAQKQPALALEILALWRASELRLVRRLALFAAADVVVPADMAADILLLLPRDELFLAGTSVEAHQGASAIALKADKRALRRDFLENAPAWLNSEKGCKETEPGDSAKDQK